MCGFYCINFIEYMLAGKTLLEYTNLFSSNNYKKNDKIIHTYFKDKSLMFRLKNYLLEEIKQWFNEWKIQKDM